MKIRSSFLFIVFLLFVSCNKKDATSNAKYSVPSEIEPYVQRFADEAKKHGRDFNFRELGLKIEFDLRGEEEWAGRCNYERPIRIEIDQLVWLAYGKDKDADLLHEELIFHELAHGFLLRDHKNDFFKYGDWVSMLCGGNGEDPPGGRKSWLVNYRGKKRDYYIDELFNFATPAPAWANTEPVFNTDVNQNIVLLENFNDNTNSWPVYTSNLASAQLYTNGTYQYSTLRENSLYVAKSLDIDKTRDFYIELDVKFISKDTSNDFVSGGLVWGGSYGGNLYYMSFTTDKRIIIGNYLNYTFYNELFCDIIKTNEFNKLAVRKVGNDFYFYVNDTYIYQTECEGFWGNEIGFLVSGNSTIVIDKLQVSYLDSFVKHKSSTETSISKETHINTTKRINIKY